MTLLDVVMIPAAVVAAWSVWSMWPVLRSLLADLREPADELPDGEWEPFCPHVAPIYTRVGPFGLVCPECARRARELWMPRG